MKKILSSLLAFAMVLALFSGIIVFNASAIDPNALVTYEYYDLTGFTQTTQAELDTLSGNVGYADGAIYNAVTSKLELTENPGEIKLLTNPANNQKYNQSIVTYVKANGATLADSPWTPVGTTLTLGEMDGIRFKLVDADGKAVSCYGQYRFIVQASGWGNYWYYRGKPDLDSDGYNVIDFSRIYRASTTNTEQMLSNELNKLDGISFLIYGAPETVYFSDLQGYVRTGSIADLYEYQDLPGFNDWTQENLDLTNALAALKDSNSQISALQFYDKAGVMRGNSTHGLLPTKDYYPNNWTQAWSTQTNVDRAVKQQNGDVFGTYKSIGEMLKWDGIRFGISTTATGGGDPATYSWDGHKRVNISLKLVGTNEKSFNNTWYPFFSCDYSCASGEPFPNYADGYIYFYFNDLKNGWADSVLSQYAKTTQEYGNFQLSYVGGGCNTEWKRLVVSDMQLFRKAVYDPTEDLWEGNYTPESWQALKEAVSTRNEDAIAAAQAALKPAVIDITTENFFKGWNTEAVNGVVELNDTRLCDSIGDGLNTTNVWNAGDFSNNTTFTAGNGWFAMTATADFAAGSMGWKNLDRNTMNTATAGAYPGLNSDGIEKGAGIRFKLTVENGTFERLLIGLSNCAAPSQFATGGHREMYALKLVPEFFDADGYINIPFSAFEAAWWSKAFAEDELDLIKVFIIEAYGVTDGTTLTVSDFTGYKVFDPADYVGDLWEYNYTSDSWAAVQEAAAAGDKDALFAAVDALKPLFVKPVTGNFFDGWTTEAVNATVNANSGKLCDSIGDGLNKPNVWNAGDFSNNTVFNADNNFSMMATGDFTGKSMGWKNMDRSKTLQTADNGAYPALNVAGLSKADGIRFKLEVEDGTVERLLIGLSNCSKFVREQYALEIKPEYVAADGYINIPFSYFKNAWWCDSFAQAELEDVIVFIVEAYGVSKFTTITISDMYGYNGRDFDIDDEDLTSLWQYNYTADSWTAYEAAIAKAKTVEERDAALDLLAPYLTIETTGNFFEGWTNEAVNAVVTANSGKLCDSIGEGLNINNAWNAGDFSNNTTFDAGDGWFSMTATADFTGKAMGWKNMDRSQTLQPDNNGAYPALNVAGLSEAEGIRFRLESSEPVERILIGLSNCSKFVREMYAMKIKPEYVDAMGYINIPFSYFEKAFWCSAFAQNELEDVIVFIIEAYGAPNGTEITISDLHGYRALTTEDVVANLWEYNYSPETWAALQTAVASGNLDATFLAVSKLESRNTKAVTGNFFDGWTTTDVTDVVTANSGKLCDSIGNGLNEKNVWNAGDFSKNTTFEANDNFSMTANVDLLDGSIGWKNMDRSKTLQPADNGAFPALNVAGLSKADGIRVQLIVEGTAERILIGLSNCSKFVREQYALGIKPEYVDNGAYINIPFSAFENAWWCSSFAQEELEDVIVFIVEAYGVTKDTRITFGEVYGYREIIAPSDEDKAALDAVVEKLQGYDITEAYAADITAAQATKDSADRDDVYEATAALQEIVDGFESADRATLKTNIVAVKAIDATLWATELSDATDVYYDFDATQDEIDAAAKVLQRIIDKPAAPTVTYTATDSTITVDEIEGAEYRLGDDAWQDSNVFEGLGADVEYQLSARIKATDDYIESDITTIAARTEKTTFGAATIAISGTEKYDEVLTAAVADIPELIGANYTITWYNGDGDKLGEGETYTIVGDDIGKTIYAELSSTVASDTVKSDATGEIGKGVIKNYTLPTATAITYPSKIGTSALENADTGAVTGTWAWVTPDEIPLISQSGSLFAITFTPDAAFADLYEGIEAEIVLTIDAPNYVVTSFVDTNGLEVEGEFMDLPGVEMHVEPIAYSEPAYQSLLRASSKDTSGLKKLVLFKRVYFTYNGEEIADIYTGGLTVNSFVGANRAGEQYSTWFFVSDKPMNYRGTVDATGTLVVENVLL